MVVGGGGGWINPLQTLSQGLVLTLCFTFGPELDENGDSAKLKSPEQFVQKVAGPFIILSTSDVAMYLLSLY